MQLAQSAWKIIQDEDVMQVCRECNDQWCPLSNEELFYKPSDDS